MKVLIVDDILENRKLLWELLKNHGLCDMSGDGQEALEMFEGAITLEQEPYDLVLLDIAMPEMDGQEVLVRMRQIERGNGIAPEGQTAIIMVSAVDASSEVEKAFKVGGCTDFLHKPISRGRLMVKLSEHGLIPPNWWEEKG